LRLQHSYEWPIGLTSTGICAHTGMPVWQEGLVLLETMQLPEAREIRARLAGQPSEADTPTGSD